jgi:hypothetical protein
MILKKLSLIWTLMLLTILGTGAAADHTESHQSHP